MKKNKDYYSSWNSEDLREFRLKIGITQAAMGEKLGLSARMYRYYENGGIRISKYLEYAVRWIVEKSKLSKETRKELEDLSKFDNDRMTRLRNAIATLVDNDDSFHQDGRKDWDKSYVKRVLAQTLKEFDIVLSKNHVM